MRRGESSNMNIPDGRGDLHVPCLILLPGYYYDLDYSCDEEDEEDVKAHLRRVSERPPLKLDTSSEVNIPHTHTHPHTSYNTSSEVNAKTHRN